MPITDRKLRVFLCHSSQDKPIVRELYQRLLAEGWIDPWLDKEKLLPGQEWKLEIEKSVESANVVIVCLSKKSVVKEGYYQKEIIKVLDVAEEKPEGTIFLIPLRLDNCNIPRRLAKWQYEDYFQNEDKGRAFLRVLESLDLRRKSLGIDKVAQSSDNNSILTRNHIDRIIGNKKRNKRININKLSDTIVINQMDFVKISAGKFIVGNNKKRMNERPEQVANISYDYWIGRYPVTVKCFADFVNWSGYQYNWYKGWDEKDDHPVEEIAFKDTREFIKWCGFKSEVQL